MQKTALLRNLENSYVVLIDSLESLPEGLIGKPLAPGKWSIGQHAAHLVLSTRPLNKALRMSKSGLNAAFGMKGERPERSVEAMVAEYGAALAKGLQAPARFVPEEIRDEQKNSLIADLRQELADLVSAIETWEESDLTDCVLPHPALGSLTVREMLFFTIYHTRHHTKTVA